MEAKVEQTPATDPNPVLSAGKDGIVLYSNEAGNTLLNGWGVKIGEKLPSSIGDLVQKVISWNSPEKTEIKVENRIYLVVFSPIPEQECVNISGFDISYRKELEGKLQESENKYRNIVETSVEGIWIFNAVSETTYVNEKMAEMLGYNREEMIGRFIWDFAYEEDKDIFQIKLANRKQGIDEVYELKLLRKDGSLLWVSVSAKGFFDDAGKFEGSVGMFTDITDRKRTEQELRESKARVESIFRSSPVGIGVAVDRMIKEANERLCEMTGYSREEMLGKSVLILYPTVEEYERVGWVKYGMIVDCGTGHVETLWQRKDGSVVDILLSSSPIIPGDLSGEITFTALDITERKRTEETLAFERSQLLSIFDGMDDMVYVADPNTYEILYANKAMKEKFGGEYEGGICYRKFQRRDSPCNFCTNQIILKERDKSYHWEYYNPLVNRHFMIMDRIIKWPDGRDVRFEIAKDITERKEVEKALKKAHNTLEEKVKERTAELEQAYNSLKESEKGLAEAQQMAHIGNWVWDIKTDSAYWSDEMYRIFGRDPQKLAPPYKEYLSYMHPDDRDHAEIIHKEAINGKHFSMDRRIVSANGEVCLIHMQTQVIFDDNDIPVKLKGTIQDITERKKAEEKIQYLANIVESSKDAIGTISLDGIITSWNKGAEQVYGYSSKEILGKHVSILAPSHLNKETMELIELIKQGKNIHHYETPRLVKDGKEIYVAITYSPVFDTNGNLTAISIIGRDITERKRAGEALRDFEIARKKEIHHRIKNNLQIISSLLDLQAEKFRNRRNIKDSEVLEAFKESQDRVTSMALIHEELHKGGEINTLNFSHYIEELADNLFLSYRLGNEGISLDTDIEEDIFFDMDIAVPLGIIINELISNSLKHAFSGRDKGEIRIKLHREEGCNTSYILSVSDNGIGIPEDLNIEDLDSLGLQLVSTLVEQLDGELELKRDNGAEFIIRFAITGNYDLELM